MFRLDLTLAGDHEVVAVIFLGALGALQAQVALIHRSNVLSGLRSFLAQLPLRSNNYTRIRLSIYRIH